jgi:hypothetical protein
MLHGSKKLTVMVKRGKKGKKAKEKESPTEGLWIAPKKSLQDPSGKRGWENRPGDPSSNNRFLELADVALGLKQSILKKR